MNGLLSKLDDCVLLPKQTTTILLINILKYDNLGKMTVF